MRGPSTQILTTIIMVLIAGFVPLPAQVARQVAAAADSTEKPKVVLVELFTSEGCSSCPPADTLLRQINGTQTAAGQLIVGISEHVTYWNSLGWSDPFSSPVYTKRQNAYGTKFGLDSVYTPQMVIDGAAQIVGSDRFGLVRALQKEQNEPSLVSLRILSIARTGTSLTVNFSTAAEASVHNADIIAVIADDADQSSVLHGENSGRTLVHVAVARSLSRVAKLRSAVEQTVQIQLPRSFHESQGHHLILFVQAPANGRVLGVDTKSL